MHVRDLPDAELPFLAAHPHRHGPGQDLDPLILASMDMTRDEAPRIEPHLQLEQLARSVSAGLQEGQVLAGERIMQMFTLCHMFRPYAWWPERASLDAARALRPARRRSRSSGRGPVSAEHPTDQLSRASAS